jgi:hypothetical protein
VLTAGQRGGSSLFPWSCGRSHGSREVTFFDDDDIRNEVETCAYSTSPSTIKTGWGVLL